MSRKKKLLLISCTVVLVAIIALMISLSSLTKYLIEKYDVEYTGREIRISRAFINPFTGTVDLQGLKVFEQESDSLFLSAENLSLDFTVYKLFSKTVEIARIQLDHPIGFIIQKEKVVNFSDLIRKFSTPKKNNKKSTWHFRISSLNIREGEFHYRDDSHPVNYFIKELNLLSIAEDESSDSVSAAFSFASGSADGRMNGLLVMHSGTLAYNLDLRIKNYDLDIMQQYIRELSNGARFEATIDASIRAEGNFKTAEDITASGSIDIANFHFGKKNEADIASFGRLALSVSELSPKRRMYLCDSVIVEQPFFKYEKYDSLDNIQTVFGKEGSNLAAAASDPRRFNLAVELVRYVKILSKNFFKSNYKVNRVAVRNGSLQFNDYSVSERFFVQLNPIDIAADSIYRFGEYVDVSVRTGIIPYGEGWVKLRLDPKDNSNFSLQYGVSQVPAAMFNPYSISYTSFPLDRGTMSAAGQWNVNSGMLQSTNHVLIIDPRFTSRIRNKNLKWLPMQLLMPFIRDRGNIIEYDIPVTGNLNNPDFNLSDVFSDLLNNILVKPATSHYRYQVKDNELKIENALSLKWEMRQQELWSSQRSFLKKIARFLRENPKAVIQVTPHYYSLKEQEYLLYFEAKKKYFMRLHGLTAEDLSENDLTAIDKMSSKDSLFIRFLNKDHSRARLHTVEQKCYHLLGKEIVRKASEKMLVERQEAFMEIFRSLDVASRVQFRTTSDIIPYNGFSFFEIKYKGATPESLKSAYRLMDEFNAGAPRQQFQSRRLQIDNSR